MPQNTKGKETLEHRLSKVFGLIAEDNDVCALTDADFTIRHASELTYKDNYDPPDPESGYRGGWGVEELSGEVIIELSQRAMACQQQFIAAGRNETEALKQLDIEDYANRAMERYKPLTEGVTITGWNIEMAGNIVKLTIAGWDDSGYWKSPPRELFRSGSRRLDGTRRP